MGEVIEITVSSQMKSANTKSDIAFHTGKENRAKFSHVNPDIDTTLSHLNVVLNFHDRDELLHKHYDELIAKHNKNNNSEARRWDLEKYLASFEGKEVMVGGKLSKNRRWSTVSQISYFGGKDSLNPVLEEMMEHGIPEQEIRDAYASGYKAYVEAHNEHFPTLPIYRSDIHFDEMTPHGHDAIVVMGHTEKGRPSDSLNNALGELYGYAKTFEGKKSNLERYRDENDGLMFDAMSASLEGLGKKYGLEFEFEPIRTGQTDSVDYREYKKKKDLEAKELEIKSRGKRQADDYNKRKEGLRERKDELTSQEAELMRERALNVRRERELREYEEKLAEQAEELRKREERLSKSSDSMRERAEKVLHREIACFERETKVTEREAHVQMRLEQADKLAVFAKGVALSVLHGDKRYERAYEQLEQMDVVDLNVDAVKRVVTSSLKDSDSRRRVYNPDVIDRAHDGPEL